MQIKSPTVRQQETHQVQTNYFENWNFAAAAEHAPKPNCISNHHIPHLHPRPMLTGMAVELHKNYSRYL